MSLSKKDFPALVARAHEAGSAAAVAQRPHLVVAVDDDSGERWGPFPICGFAWVRIRPATSSFARWAKEHAGFSPAYPSGLDLWVGGYGQSYDLKLAYARGFAAVLEAAGIDAHGDGRLD